MAMMARSPDAASLANTTRSCGAARCWSKIRSSMPCASVVGGAICCAVMSEHPVVVVLRGPDRKHHRTCAL
jgi:hypothetical protein